jgi:HD-like signal output (HDOD) protein
MSLEAARRWLEQHHRPLPSHPAILHSLGALLEQQAATDRLIALIQQDPATSALLLSAVNRRRQAEPVESLAAAASLLGEPALIRLLQERLQHHGRPDRPHQSFLYSQLLERSLHNAWQAEGCAQRLGFSDLDSLRTAASLMYLGEMSCCLHAPDDYLDVYLRGGGSKAAGEVLGFDFSELGQVLAEQERLPERVAQAQPHRQSAEAKTRLLRLTTRLCRHCEQGWRNERVTADLQQLAQLMQRPIDEIAAQVHQSAVEAARCSPHADAWHPASRLPLIADGPWAPPARKKPPAEPARSAASTPPPSPAAPVRGAQTRDRLQALLRSQDSTQSQLLQACLQGLQQELGFSRISLFLLSRDRKMLQNRLALGLDERAPIRRYAVDTARAGLLARLLEKPQAIHVHPANWAKFEPLIPPSLLARLDTRDFAAMSVFIGDKPIGIILADRKGRGDIEAGDFRLFKQVVGLCNKALTLLARRQQPR